MRKEATAITVATLVLGVFGAFLRWLQSLNGFEKETGLAVPGSGSAAVFLIYSILVALAIVAFAVVWFRRYHAAASAPEVLGLPYGLFTAVAWVIGAVFLIASILLMFSIRDVRYPRIQQIFAAAGIFAGLAFPVLVGRKANAESASRRIAATFLTLFGCFWMIFAYKCNAENPVLWRYVVEVLAVCAVTLMFYYVCAFFYAGRATPRNAVIFSALSAFLCFASLPDPRATAVTVLYFCAALMSLMLEFILLYNLQE